MSPIKEIPKLKDTQTEQQMVFIGGSDRSGTTLVQAMLNAHKDIFGGPEFGYLRKICEMRTLIESSINPINKLDVYFRKEELNQIFKEFVLKLLEKPCLKNEKKIISEKSPNNIMVFSELVKFFPDAKYIFVVRNPMAIYSSFKDIKRKAKLNRTRESVIPGYSLNLYRGITFINERWRRGFDFIEKHSNNSILIVYEDIVSDPEGITKNLCEFLGIKWDPNMLNHSGKMDKIIKDNEVSIWGGAEMYHQRIHKNSIDKWRNNLSESEIIVIQKKIFINSYLKERYFDEKDKKSITISSLFVLMFYNFRKNKDFFIRRLRVLLKRIS